MLQCVEYTYVCVSYQASPLAVVVCGGGEGKGPDLMEQTHETRRTRTTL